MERERVAVEADEKKNKALRLDQLVERGDAIQELTITVASPSALVLRCPLNESRLRIGDGVELTGTSGRFTATIADLRDNGCEMHLRSVQSTRHLDRGPWTAQALPVDVSALVIACLKKLKPGAPGWSFFRTCSGESPPVASSVSESVSERQSSIAAAILSSQSTDASQEAAFRRCLELPHAFAAQGPPGTGKTRVLALVAEGLARMGKRTLVVAPTHQAVNNALSAIRRCFPGRRAVKVGDELRRESLDADVECTLFVDGSRQSGIPVSSETITGMTFVSAMHHLILRKNALAPNVVIIEEAGQLPLAHGACAGLIGAASILMFGDDLQMPPVFPAELEDDPTAESLFARLRASQPQLVSTLLTTYRLNAELCNVIGRTFYGGRLRSSVDARDRRLCIDVARNAPCGAGRMVLSSEASFVWVESRGDDARQANLAEAEFVAETVHTCLLAGLSADAVAVVTPFRRQAALIRNQLQARLPPVARLPIIDTVERVQGLTVELVLVSLCASEPAYVASVGDFLCHPNRLNVAISRARTKAILVASSALTSWASSVSKPDLAFWRSLLQMPGDHAFI